ncbi:adenosylcobinamide-phosphate synthase CbiB [Halogranum rubrum]|uniref:Probable cobalamin biosynthesis protein CobD n=1 Tax=Halogranum salarium B-1 TaxID=1210908 RepID=J3A609_9EURY|nr:adenosylcobinamide-phosphate synthase CbiB [Halogranum salarium]EJN60918.1 adenosylcobinamide-phosphate synthase [Halogranum salarium B-1]
MGLTATTAVVLGAGLDVVFAEPPTRVHPVVWFGKVVEPFDREWSNPRAASVVVALGLPFLAAFVVWSVVDAVVSILPAAGALLAAVVLFSTTSLRMLTDTTRDVVALTERDLDAARTELRALAGRDASALSHGEVRSAAVESLAENLADGLVGPLFGFVLFAPLSLSLGTAAAVWVKAVNTLDSMLGYRSKPVGWAPARLDDAVMWVPARLSALLLALAAHDPAALHRAREDARVPSSPNSGWPMATLAVALDVRLEKTGHYRLNAGHPLPTAVDAEHAVRVVTGAGLLAVALAGVVVWF